MCNEPELPPSFGRSYNKSSYVLNTAAELISDGNRVGIGVKEPSELVSQFKEHFDLDVAFYPNDKYENVIENFYTFYANNLSRAKAQSLFANRKKISHKLFEANEFVFLNENNKMEDENGIILNKIDFWLIRGSIQFDFGWFTVL